MRKNIKTTEAIFQMSVLMIAAYNEDAPIINEFPICF